ncbi:MFS transporter [Streptomyces sp. NPDC004658]|uniref:MFS transporter n=1 Tax=Streptomyces sp. NPDC004658 TaxID=3154672 RepID=UPI0033ACA6EF
MSTPHSRPSYAAVLRVPHARRTFTAALTARLSYGMVSLAVLLSVTHATGSYTVSGTVLSLFGATTVFLMPLRASLIDRHGPRLVLPPMSALYGVLLSVLAVLTWRPGAPAAAVGLTAALAGSCAPPLGPTMRALWSELVTDRNLLRRAYSLDGVAEELLYVSGPALIALLGGFAPPAAGILLSAALNAGGTCGFVTSPAMTAQRRTPREEGSAGVRLAGEGPAGEGPDGEGSAGEKAASGLPVEAQRVREPAGLVRGLLPPVAVALGAGLALSAVELLVMAFATERSYDPALVPWVLGALSAGSALGGLANGVVRWRTSARTRLCRFGVCLGLVLAAAGLAPDLWTLTAAMACAGAFIAPALTTAYLLADESAPESARTRAGAWVNMAVNAGSSGGAMAAGLLIGRLPLPLCFTLAGGTALVAAVAAGCRVTGTAARVGAAASRQRRAA